MKYLSPRIFSIGFALLALGAGAQLRAAGFPQDESDLRPDANARFGVLPNGVKYIIMANREPEDRASLRLVVGAGSFNETAGQEGLAHFLAHLAFKGSVHYPSGTLAAALQRWGMSADPEDDSQTDFEYTDYLLDLPDTRAATLKEGLQVFSDFAGGLLLPEAQIEAERPVLLAEKIQRDSAAYRSQIAEMNFTMGESLVPKRLPIGLGSVIEKAHRKELDDFYATWYRPEKMTVIAVGDFEPDDVEAMIKDAFGDVRDRAPTPPEPVLGDIPLVTGLQVQFHPEPLVRAVTISIETVTPYYHEADVAASRLQYLRRGLAFAMFNRRLAQDAAKDNAPFESASADVGEQFDFVHNTSLHLIAKPANWHEALNAGEQELRRAIEYGFQPAELGEIVASMRKGLEQAARPSSLHNSARLADGLVRSVTRRQVFTSPAENLDLYGPALASLTAQDCSDAFRKAWAAKGRYLFVAGNLTLPHPEQALTAAYQASQAVAVQPLPKIEEVKFTYTDFGAPGEVASRKEIADLGITEIVFANGVRLNLKKTDFAPGKIDVNVRVGGGKLTEPADTEPGLAELTQGAFISGGLGRLDFEDLQRALAGQTVGLNFRVLDDAFDFSGSTDAGDLAVQLQLIAAYLTDPGYRPEAMAQARGTIPELYGRMAQTPEGVVDMKINRILAGGDPRFGMPPEVDLLARKFEDVKAWLTPQFDHGPLEVAIVGDFDPAAAIDAVARTFGALPKREAKPDYAAARVVAFPSTPLDKEYSAAATDKSIILVVWPTTDGRDRALSYRLGLLASVFSARLRAKIHGDKNDVVPPSARSNPSLDYPGYGMIMVNAAVAPDQAGPAMQTVLSIADELQKNGVLDDEFARAKQSALSAIDQTSRSNDYWLNSVLADAQEHPRVEEARRRQDEVNAITAADITDLANRFLDPARAFKFVIAPDQPAADQPAPAITVPTGP